MRVAGVGMDARGILANFAKRSAEPYFESLQNCNDCNIKKECRRSWSRRSNLTLTAPLFLLLVGPQGVQVLDVLNASIRRMLGDPGGSNAVIQDHGLLCDTKHCVKLYVLRSIESRVVR